MAMGRLPAGCARAAAPCGPEGMAKAVAQGIGPERRREIEECLEADGVREYRGEVRLPV